LSNQPNTLAKDFENLLNAIKPRNQSKIIQENKKTETQSFGKPYFKISEKTYLEIGWIETKPFKTICLHIFDSPQLKRYLNIFQISVHKITENLFCFAMANHFKF
jgi:hypothetical protein